MIMGLYINNAKVGEICGEDYAGEVWADTKRLAQLLDAECLLVNLSNGNILDSWYPE